MRPRLAQTAAFSWKSEFLDGGEPVGATRAVNLVEWVFSRPEFRREIGKVIDSLGGPQSPRLWDLYFRRCYNAIEGLSHGYIQLLLDAARDLPPRGLIYDCGGGPGNFSTALLSLSPERRVHLFDSSPIALGLARETVRRFGVEGRFQASRKNLRGEFGSEGGADGMVMNNVLYALGNERVKLAFLKRAHGRLRPGGTLILCDPTPTFQRESGVREHLRQVVAAAAYHRSLMSAYDVALYTEINRKVLGQASAPFLSPSALVSLAHRAGFALTDTPRCRFYGVDTYLVLRKVR